jgi:hypothetical protein
VNQSAIPRGSQADYLGKNRGATIPSDAVTCFAPPIVGGHLKPLDGIVFVDQLVDFFRQGQTRNQVRYAVIQRQRGI